MLDRLQPRHDMPLQNLLARALGLSFVVAACFLMGNVVHAAEKRVWAPALRPSAIKDEALVDSAPVPKQEQQDHPARRAIERESFYAPDNPDLDRLQHLEDVTRGMPFDTNGFPDWMRLIKEGFINPRASLKGQGKMEVLDLDIIMRNTKEMPNVRFPHRSHTLWLDCSNCHPEPFKPVAGSNAIRMADIFRGQFCGRCHDRVAFITFFSCMRCHSVPQGTAASAKPQ